MPGLTYRNALLTDLPSIVAIYNSTVPSRLVTADTEPVSVESRLPWFEAHNAHKRPLWVVEDGEKNIVGWVSFQSFYGRPAYDATAEISIYLADNRRGKGWVKRYFNIASIRRLRLASAPFWDLSFRTTRPACGFLKKQDSAPGAFCRVSPCSMAWSGE